MISLSPRLLTIISIIAMGFVIFISNILVQYPINDWLTYGAFTYPLCFLITDIINRYHGVTHARMVVAVGFVIGVILSIGGGDMRIAIASGSAYFITQMLDIQIFDKLRAKIWWCPPLVSSVIAGVMDTILFWGIAFYGTDLPWVTWAIGDGVVKLAVVTCALIPYGLLLRSFKLKSAM